MSMALAQPQTASHPATDSPPPCVVIESGIPIPRKRRGVQPYSAAGRALRILAVGESFVWPRKKGELVEKRADRAGSLVNHLKPKKFSVRVVEENGKRAVRVWRVA